MSLYMENDTPSIQIRIVLATKILDDIAPKLYGGHNITFMDRLALAITWFKFLKQVSSNLLPDIPENPDKWGEEEIKKIADSLVIYARNLLGKAI